MLSIRHVVDNKTPELNSWTTPSLSAPSFSYRRPPHARSQSVTSFLDQSFAEESLS